MSEFESVKQRLQEIADAVDDENISLDQALDLYEEAVSLGLQASDLLEVGINPDEAEAADAASSDEPPSEATQPSSGASDAADSATQPSDAAENAD